MDKTDSIPDAPVDDAGGNGGAPAPDDHSQDAPAAEADKPADGQPSTPTDTPPEGDKPAEGEPPAEDGTGAPASQFDKDLDDWATKHGHEKPENDRERQLLQTIRNGQREFSRDQQAKKAAGKLQDAAKAVKPGDQPPDDDDDIDPLEQKVGSLEAQLAEERTARLQAEYFETNNVTDDEAEMMGTILTEKVEKAAKRGEDAAKAAFEYWNHPDQLEDWHGLAKARLAGNTDTGAIAEEAARKERERIAQESKANGPVRSAAHTTTSDKTEDQERLERFSNWDK